MIIWMIFRLKNVKAIITVGRLFEQIVKKHIA